MKKIMSAYALHSAKQFYESINEAANTSYYLFAANPTVDGSPDITEPEDTPFYRSSLFRSMLFGKTITEDNLAYVVPRYDWTSNTVYDAYSDDDEFLFTKQFYAIVNASSQYHIWKCLSNANNTPSTVEPSIDAVTADDGFYQTSDGYVWKYMTSVTDQEVSRFASQNYFPVIANTTVANAAVNGSIDFVTVLSGGNNYGNYLAGYNQFASSDMRLEGNNLLYDISANSDASSANDYYNGCIIYIKDGVSDEIGQYRTIVDYVVNSTSRTIVLDSQFANSLSISSVYDIYPAVHFSGLKTQSTNAVGRAIISPYGNVVSRIEMLDSGSDYQVATANVTASNVVGNSPALLRPIISPEGGHGADVLQELGCSRITVSVTFSNTEANTILQSSDYSTVGILKDPSFANVVLTGNVSGTFIPGEIVNKVNPILLGSDGSVNSTSAVMTTTLGDFTVQVEVGDTLLIRDETIESRQLAVVNSVVNSSYLTFTTNAQFTSANVQYLMPRVTSYGTVASANSSVLRLASLTGEADTDDVMIGLNSGASIVVAAPYRSGVAKGYETFINAHKYSGSVVSGTFVEGEVVYQTSLRTANAMLHSYITDGSTIDLYTFDQSGVFVTNASVSGVTSNALASITSVYGPEIISKSGDVLYVEDINPVNRAPTQRETFKITLRF